MTTQLPPSEVARHICSIVRSHAAMSADDVVPLHEPRFEGNEWNYLRECIDTGWVSSAGSYVDEFERRLASYTGSPWAVLTVNGTAALHVALRLVGVRRDDEVLVPALTFVATANAVAYCGATPHFVDSHPETLGVDPDKLAEHLEEVAEKRDGVCVHVKTGATIRAVVPMHTFGHPVDLEALDAVCARYSITMVEDAAESIGSLYRGEHTGTWGRFGVLSFNGNKIITTGGGGALLTRDQDLADRAKHLSTTAKKDHPWRYWHDTVGYNYRMPNLNAALGCAQLECLPSLLTRKRKLAEEYERSFAQVEALRFVREPAHGKSNYWLNAVLLPDETSADERDETLQHIYAAGVRARPAWTPLHRLPMYRDCPRMDLSVAEALHRRIITLPSSPERRESEKAGAAPGL